MERQSLPLADQRGESPGSAHAAWACPHAVCSHARCKVHEPLPSGSKWEDSRGAANRTSFQKDDG
eukprot:2542215-Amphidinium_carterae.3